jgi:hypothetical protein
MKWLLLDFVQNGQGKERLGVITTSVKSHRENVVDVMVYDSRYA